MSGMAMKLAQSSIGIHSLTARVLRRDLIGRVPDQLKRRMEARSVRRTGNIRNFFFRGQGDGPLAGFEVPPEV